MLAKKTLKNETAVCEILNSCIVIIPHNGSFKKYFKRAHYEADKDRTWVVDFHYMFGHFAWAFENGHIKFDHPKFEKEMKKICTEDLAIFEENYKTRIDHAPRHDKFFMFSDMKKNTREIKFKNPTAICEAFRKSSPRGEEFSEINDPMFFFFYSDRLDFCDIKLAEAAADIDKGDIKTLSNIEDIKTFWTMEIIKIQKPWDEIIKIRTLRTIRKARKRAQDEKKNAEQAIKEALRKKELEEHQKPICLSFPDLAGRSDRSRYQRILDTMYNYKKLLDELKNSKSFERDDAMKRLGNALARLQVKMNRLSMAQAREEKAQAVPSLPKKFGISMKEYTAMSPEQRKEFLKIKKFLLDNNLCKIEEVYDAHCFISRDDRLKELVLCDDWQGFGYFGIDWKDSNELKGIKIEDYGHSAVYNFWGQETGDHANYIRFLYDGSVYLVGEAYNAKNQKSYYPVLEENRRGHKQAHLPCAETYYKYLKCKVR